MKEEEETLLNHSFIVFFSFLQVMPRAVYNQTSTGS